MSEDRQLVRITWQDAQYDSGWFDPEKWVYLSEPIVVIGYVVENTDEYVEITMTEHGQCLHGLRVYHAMILELEEIELL